jgi:hypothetical protein
VLRVLHLVGSATDDFYAELSRLYARDCLAATADPARYAFAVAWVTPDGRWRFPADLGDDAIAAAEPLSTAAALAHLAALRPDVVVPQMFCLPGMTAYRALFDLLGIPYSATRPTSWPSARIRRGRRRWWPRPACPCPPGRCCARVNSRPWPRRWSSSRWTSTTRTA